MFRVVGVMAAIFVAVWFFAGDGVSGLFGDGRVTLRPGGSPMSSGPQQPASAAPSVGDPERAAPTPAPPAEPQREIIRFVTAGGTFGMVEHDSEIPAGARVLGRTVMSARSEGRPAADAMPSADGSNRSKSRAKEEREADSMQQADKWREIWRHAYREYSDMASRVLQERQSFFICTLYDTCLYAYHAQEVAWLEMQRLHEYMTSTILRECDEQVGCKHEWIVGSTEKERSQWNALESEQRRLEVEYQVYEQRASSRLEAKRRNSEMRQKWADAEMR